MGGPPSRPAVSRGGRVNVRTAITLAGRLDRAIPLTRVQGSVPTAAGPLASSFTPCGAELAVPLAGSLTRSQLLNVGSRGGAGRLNRQCRKRVLLAVIRGRGEERESGR